MNEKQKQKQISNRTDQNFFFCFEEKNRLNNQTDVYIKTKTDRDRDSEDWKEMIIMYYREIETVNEG